MNNELLVFTGNGHPELAARMAEGLHVELGKADVGRFPDDEIRVKIHQDVRGADVFVIQSTCHPVNDNLMELLIFIDALRRASAKRITAVIPYFGYARQDRKDEGRVPITAKLVADLIASAGADRVLTLDLHAAQIQGFFNIPVDHLYAAPVFIDHFARLEIPDLVVASPDIGSIKMAWAYCKKLEGYLATVEKRRLSPEEVETQFLIGDVEGKNVLLVDDLIGTAGTITEACAMLKDKGAQDVYMCATHPVLCGQAVDRLREAPVEQIAVCDTIPTGEKAQRIPTLEVLSVADLLAEAVRRIHWNESVSQLFV